MTAKKRTEIDRGRLAADNERRVIGCCILSPEAIDTACGILRPEMFRSEAFGIAFAALRDMRNDGVREIDCATLTLRLDKQKQLEGVGGPEELLTCMESVPFAAHVKSYASEVREEWQRSRVHQLGESCIRRSLEREPIDEILAGAESAIHAVIEETVPTTEEDIGEILRRATGAGFAKGQGLQVGFPRLDQITSGLQPGQLIYLAARPSIGKSALAMNISQNVCEQGEAVLFVSLEMSKLDLAVRMLCRGSGLTRHHINSGKPEYNPKILAAAEQLGWLKMFISDHPAQTVIQISAMARLLKRRKNIRLVVLDYLQLVEPEDHRVPREQQVARMSRRLKCLAKSIELPVICLAQLNRESEKRVNKKPMLSDLRESGSLEQDADMVWLLHRPGFYDAAADQHEAELIVAKHRNGETGTIKLGWDNGSTTFREVEQEVPFE